MTTLEAIRLDSLMIGDEVEEGIVGGIDFRGGIVYVRVSGSDDWLPVGEADATIDVVRPGAAPARLWDGSRGLRVGVREDPDLAQTVEDIAAAVEMPYPPPTGMSILRQNAIIQEARASVALDGGTQSMEALPPETAEEAPDSSSPAGSVAALPPGPQDERRGPRVKEQCPHCEQRCAPGGPMAQHIKRKHHPQGE